MFIPDFILLDSNQLKHNDFMVNPAKNFMVIMKKWNIYKLFKETGGVS